MKHAYMIIAHNLYEQLIFLINYIKQYNDVYLHIDKKNKDLFIKVKEYYKDIDNVFILDNNIKAYWSGFSLIEAEILLIEKVLNSNIEYDYATLISGTTFPIQKDEKFKEFLIENKGNEFIEVNNVVDKIFIDKYFAKEGNFRWSFISRVIQRVIYHLGIRNKFALSYYNKHPFVHGSQWFTLTYQALDYIYKEYHKEYDSLTRIYKRYRYSDERIFHTIIKYSNFKDKLANKNLTCYPAGGWKTNIAMSSPEICNLQQLTEQLNKDNTDIFFARKFNFTTFKETKDKLKEILDIEYN